MEDLEKTYERFILQQVDWDQLPVDTKKSMGNSKETWKQNVVRFSIRHQLRWKSNLVRLYVSEEKMYYQEILRFSRAHFMLYPYHIADVLVRGLRVTPFRYYFEMMHDVMQDEKSYDVLPNFTAADCVRVLGIGRNQYIDIMNNIKAKGGFQKNWLFSSKKKKNIIRDFLPTNPERVHIEYWWIVSIGYVSEEDVQQCGRLEQALVDLLIDEGPKQAGQLPKNIVQSLYAKNLIYLDIPISNTDQFVMPPLRDFVMNRVSGDYFENLLYKVFVSLDERTTVEGLAKILDIDIELIKQAISLFIRLGMASKKNVEPITFTAEATDDIGRTIQNKWHPSWIKTKDSPVSPRKNDNSATPDLLIDFDEPMTSSLSSSASEIPVEPRTPTPVQSPPPARKKPTSESQEIVQEELKRVGFLFDSTLAAYLMMGNLTAGLKAHAVTMFEAGKLNDEQMDDFLMQLDKIDLRASEGEAQRYFDHAITLRNTLRFMRKNEANKIKGCDGGVDLVRCERLNSLDHAARIRVLSRSYAILISMAPLTGEALTITSSIPRHFGPIIPEVMSPWFKLYIYNAAKSGPDSILFPKGLRVNYLPEVFETCELVRIEPWGAAEPYTTPVSNLLLVLNDILLAGPVLVQAWTHRTAQDKGGLNLLEEPKSLFVPFPLEPSLVDYGANELEYTEFNIHSHPAVKALDKAMNLSKSIGYIKMILIDDPTTGILKWVPFDIQYGMPLFDKKLNREVCNKIEKFGLFEENNLREYSKSCRDLSLRLLDFIGQKKQEELDEKDLEADIVPLPNQIVSYFYGESINSPIADVQDLIQ